MDWNKTSSAISSRAIDGASNKVLGCQQHLPLIDWQQQQNNNNKTTRTTKNKNSTGSAKIKTTTLFDSVAFASIASLFPSFRAELADFTLNVCEALQRKRSEILIKIDMFTCVCLCVCQATWLHVSILPLLCPLLTWLTFVCPPCCAVPVPLSTPVSPRFSFSFSTLQKLICFRLCGSATNGHWSMCRYSAFQYSVHLPHELHAELFMTFDFDWGYFSFVY